MEAPLRVPPAVASSATVKVTVGHVTATATATVTVGGGNAEATASVTVTGAAAGGAAPATAQASVNASSASPREFAARDIQMDQLTRDHSNSTSSRPPADPSEGRG